MFPGAPQTFSRMGSGIPSYHIQLPSSPSASRALRLDLSAPGSWGASRNTEIGCNEVDSHLWLTTDEVQVIEVSLVSDHRPRLV